MGPAETASSNESQLNVLTASPGEHIFHANRYLRLAVPEVGGMIVDSSVDRQETFNKAEQPRTKTDVVNLLGDTSHGRHQLFRDNGCEEIVKTIAVGKYFSISTNTQICFSQIHIHFCRNFRLSKTHLGAVRRQSEKSFSIGYSAASFQGVIT